MDASLQQNASSSGQLYDYYAQHENYAGEPPVEDNREKIVVYLDDEKELFYQFAKNGKFVRKQPEENEQVVIEDEKRRKLRVQAREKLEINSEDEWEFVTLDNGDSFFFNITTDQSHWRLPQAIEAMLMNPAEHFLKASTESTGEQRESNVEQQKRELEAPAVNEEVPPSSAPEPVDILHDPSRAEAVQQFRQMIIDNKVSPFSTWEKELSKICFDPRFSLVPNMEDKKLIFANYCKTRPEEERQEKIIAKQKAVEAFQKLLDTTLTSNTRWPDFAKEYGKNAAFTGLRDARERENMFLEKMKILLTAEQPKRPRDQESSRESRHQSGSSSSSSSSHKKRRDDDSRERERERDSKRRRYEEDPYAKQRSHEERKQKAEADFKALLAEKIKLRMTYREALDKIRYDSRYEAGGLITDLQKQQLFRQHVSKL